MKYLILTAFVLSVAACSSTPDKPVTAEIQPDKVIGRIDDLSARPDYIRESEPFRFENGMVTSLGQTTIPADHRVEAAYRIADSNAKAAIASAIEARLEYVFQNAEEGTSIDSTQARYIGSEASQLTTSSIRTGKRYWEKIAMTTDSGERITRYRVFTTVTMPENDFKRAVLDAVRRAQGKGGLSQDFAEKVNQHWDKFVGNQPTQPQSASAKSVPERKSSSTDDAGE